MEVFAVPVDGRYLVYRPLVPLAFVANGALADAALQLAADPGLEVPALARAFLERIGFLRPDPPPPPPPGHEWHPTTAVVLLTNRCNLRCTYCYANAGVATPHDTSADLARAVIDAVHRNARALGAPRFAVSFHGGGEPMRAWQVMREVAEHARAKDLPCELTMVSNGVWSRAQREWVLATLDGVTISLDGGPATQDHQRPLAGGRGSSRHVLETVQALDAAGARYGIRMTATAPFREHFPADVRYLCEHTACRDFQVEPAFNTKRGSHEQASEDEGADFVDAFVEAYDVATAAGRRLTYSGARPWLRGRAFCTAPYDALIVNADGHLVTCYEIADDSHWLAEFSTIGRLAGEDVWLDVAARERLLHHLEAKQKDQCADCFCRWHCAGDCYTRASVRGPDGIVGTPERCAVNRGITAQLLLRNILAAGGTVWRGEPLVGAT